MGRHPSAPGASAARARDGASPQMAAEPPARDPAQPGTPPRRDELRRTPAVMAAFGTGSGAAIVFHDLASI